MKLGIISIIILITFPLLSHSQTTPLFSMPLYFEDALGNKDSLVVGYAIDADDSQLNPQYGEVLLTEPFDSVFEVWACHGDDWLFQSTKTIIAHYQPSSWGICASIEGIKVFMRVKYPPIKMTWNKQVFMEDTCHQNITLCPDWGIYTLPFPEEAGLLTCIWGLDVWETDFSYLQEQGYSWQTEKFNIEGQGLQYIPGFFFGQWDYNICLLVGTENQEDVRDCSLFPNPADNLLHLQLRTPAKQGTSLLLYNTTGQLIGQCQMRTGEKEEEFEVHGLTNGMYIYVVRDEDSILATGKQVIVR